jgi:hypothetical protein
MAATAAKPKTAIQALAEKMGELVEKAAERMDDKQFRQAEKRSAAITARVRARASRRDKA